MKVGDVVRLKGQTQPMTVISVFTQNDIEVAWFSPERVLFTARMDSEALEIVQSQSNVNTTGVRNAN